MAELTFEQWMDRVNDCIVNIAGIGRDDLPDQPFRDWYEAEMSPEAAARDTLEDAGLDMDDFEAA